MAVTQECVHIPRVLPYPKWENNAVSDKEAQGMVTGLSLSKVNRGPGTHGPLAAAQ